MKKIIDSISVVLFFSFIILFATSTLVFQKEKIKNVQISKNQNIVIKAESFVNDNFSLLSNWKSIHSRLIIGTGQSKIGNVFVLDDRLIETIDSINDDKLNESINEINSFKQQYPNISTYALVVPTASGIYSSQLPTIANAVDQQKKIDDIYYQLDKSINTLDAYNSLFTARDDYIYFKTDNRWTALGAYSVYSNVISKMGYKPVSLSNYDVEYGDRKFLGNLYEKTFYKGVSEDTINIFKNKNGSSVTNTTSYRGKQKFTSKSVYYNSGLQSDDKYNIFLNGDAYKTTTITTTVDNAPRILIIKSSYANCFVPFLTQHYSEIIMVDLNNFENEGLKDVVDVGKYDQILFLYDLDSFCKNDSFNLLNYK